jgi:hypothetical protein
MKESTPCDNFTKLQNHLEIYLSREYWDWEAFKNEREQGELP